MKRKPCAILTAAMLLASIAVPVPSQASDYDWTRLIGAGAKVLQANQITDQQMASYVRQYVDGMDQKSELLGPESPYTIRLKNITQGLTSIDGIPLNFAVYKTNDVNAFACADGSVRVYSGLMDIMTDDEVLGVIGHEIGHVAHHDTKKAFKQALINSALRDGIAANGGVIGALTDSQLGALGESLLSAKYSRKQESQADDYGYQFLKQNGKNPWAMAMAFQRLKAIQGSGEQGASWVNNMFSDHPDLDKRIAAMSKMATADGFTRPADGKVGNDGSAALHPAAPAKPSAAKDKTSKTKSSKKKSSKKKSSRRR